MTTMTTTTAGTATEPPARFRDLLAPAMATTAPSMITNGNATNSAVRARAAACPSTGAANGVPGWNPEKATGTGAIHSAPPMTTVSNDLCRCGVAVRTT